jgi:DNA-binding response OmpR family regulator
VKEAIRMARFLIIEDDEALTAFLRCNHEAEDRDAEKTSLRDGAEVEKSQERADVVVLCWTLPGALGVELYRREPKGFPVVIAAVGEEAERIRNVVQALLRRTHPELGGSLLRVGDIELDRYDNEAHRW